MARVIGTGCLGDRATPELVDAITHVELEDSLLVLVAPVGG